MPIWPFSASPPRMAPMASPPGSPWLFLAPPGSSWLPLAPPGFSWLLLASPASSWLRSLLLCQDKNAALIGEASCPTKAKMWIPDAEVDAWAAAQSLMLKALFLHYMSDCRSHRRYLPKETIGGLREVSGELDSKKRLKCKRHVLWLSSGR